MLYMLPEDHYQSMLTKGGYVVQTVVLYVPRHEDMLSGDTASLFLDFGIKWRTVVNFIVRPFYSRK